MRIERPDVGEGNFNEVTYKPITFGELESITTGKKTPLQITRELLSRALLVDGEIQPSAWYSNLPLEIFEEYQKALQDLMPIKVREMFGLLTPVEKIKQTIKFRQQLEEEGLEDEVKKYLTPLSFSEPDAQ